MKRIEAIIRTDRVDQVVVALRKAGVPRLTVLHVHALGKGVDPEDYRLSLEAGAAYTEKAKLELVCRSEDTQRLVELIRREARTGQRGDGIIVVVDIDRCVKIRTGDENQLALL